MRSLLTGLVVVGVLAGPAGAGDTATITVKLSVAPYAVVENITPPTMPVINRPNQAVTGQAGFRVTTNHNVTAYLGQPGDYLSGPGGTFFYGQAGAPLSWSANFIGRAIGAGLPIGAGARQAFQVEVHAGTAGDWQVAHAGSYTGHLSLTLVDR